MTFEKSAGTPPTGKPDAELREEALRRIAVCLDMPAELLANETDYGVGLVVDIVKQIPQVQDRLTAVLGEHGGDPSTAAGDNGLRRTWEEAEPETRAGLLLELAWAARSDDVGTEKINAEDVSADFAAAGWYAEDLHRYALLEQYDREKFLGEKFPVMPLPGPAGTLASSLGFDRDDLDISLGASLILMSAASQAPRDGDGTGA